MRLIPPALSRKATLALIRASRITDNPERRAELENEIVKGNLGFATYLAAKFRNRGVDHDDLVSAATVGLLRAIRMFDLTFTADKWPGYARRCAMRDLNQEVQRHGSPMRLPRTVPLTSAPRLSLDDPESGAGALVAGEEDDGEAAAVNRIDAARLEKLVEHLPEREARVVTLRFGLAGGAPHELYEIGALLGVSKQRAHVLLTRALDRLKKLLLPKAA